ncbi:MAG: hypothetical protein HDT30_06150, partial [Clostridiales bacterium]|nr:hypothetical protein [Clostridiales bacterium]
MRKRIKISDYPNIKKQIGRISVIISMYFIGSFTVRFIISAIKCLKEIEEWTVACAEPGYDIELSRSFFNFFVVGAAIGIIMFIYQACRYNNIRTTKLGKSIWKFMEVKDDSYFENE